MNCGQGYIKATTGRKLCEAHFHQSCGIGPIASQTYENVRWRAAKSQFVGMDFRKENAIIFRNSAPWFGWFLEWLMYDKVILSRQLVDYLKSKFLYIFLGKFSRKILQILIHGPFLCVQWFSRYYSLHTKFEGRQGRGKTVNMTGLGR